MTTLLQDLRFAVRTLWARPAFTIIAIVTVALGIGANTAMFSTVDAILLRPLSYPSAEQLVMVWEHHPSIAYDQIPTSPADFKDWQEQNKVFSDMAVFFPTTMNLTGSGIPERVSAVASSANAFSMLGSRALVGRTFGPEDARADAPLVGVLSRGTAVRVFGSETAALGHDVALNGQHYQIVGVMPSGFEFPPSFSFIGRMLVMKNDVWIPLKPEDLGGDRGKKSLFTMARLKSGVDAKQAQSNMDSINSALSKQYPATNDGISVSVVPLHEQVVRNSRTALLALFGAVGLVLLIACANVANLLLARASGRHKEMAIRTALGGTNWHLIRQLLTESLALSIAGSVIGLLIALWGTDMLRRFGPEDIPRLSEVRIDATALAFTFVVATVTGILFGLAPALQARRIDLIVALKEGSRSSTAGARRQRVRGTLVILETALALVLLIGSGLLIQSLVRLQNIDPGFNTRNLLTFNIALSPTDYREPGAQRSFFERVMERIRAVPGVQSASMGSGVPLTTSMSASDVTAEGQPIPARKEDLGATTKIIGPDYFRTMGMLIKQGREFTEADRDGALPVAVINETMARRFWPGLNPVGRRVKIGDTKDPNPWLTVVGIAGDARNWAIERPVESELYSAFAQSPSNRMTILVRSDSDPGRLTETLRRQVIAVDPAQPIFAVQSMTQYVTGSFTSSRFRTVLSALFAGLAALLAALGIYGVMTYFVSERVGEIGIRMALGARKDEVLRMVLGQGMKLVGTGIGVGLVLAIAMTRTLSNLLFGISALDPLTFIVVAAAMALVAAAAIYIPARRATRIDPLVALRYE